MCVVFVMLCLAVLVKHRLVTDRQTDRRRATAYTTLARIALRGKGQIPLRYLVADRFEAGRRPAARAR